MMERITRTQPKENHHSRHCHSGAHHGETRGTISVHPRSQRHDQHRAQSRSPTGPATLLCRLRAHWKQLTPSTGPNITAAASHPQGCRPLAGGHTTFWIRATNIQTRDGKGHSRKRADECLRHPIQHLTVLQRECLCMPAQAAPHPWPNAATEAPPPLPPNCLDASAPQSRVLPSSASPTPERITMLVSTCAP